MILPARNRADAIDVPRAYASTSASVTALPQTQQLNAWSPARNSMPAASGGAGERGSG